MSSSPGGGIGRARDKLVVISGPSGAGKTSICRALLSSLPDAVWSVSATTRPKRPGDESGSSYEFIDTAEFDARRQAGEFLETAQYVGQWYGTPRRPVEEALAAGKYVILEIEVQGGRQVAKAMPESVRIFVMPPNMESLRARLEGRQTEAAQQLASRLGEADGEIATARDGGYDHFVVNDVLEETIEEVKRIITEGKQGAMANDRSTDQR